MLVGVYKDTRPHLELPSEFILENGTWKIWEKECITKDESKAMFRANSKPRNS